MFSVSDVLVINKLDYFELEDFNVVSTIEKVKVLNETIQVFPLSCKTSAGLENWISWLENEIQ